MKKFSVIGQVFRIDIGDVCARINGLELGLAEGQRKIEWEHVNNALGNVALLLAYLLNVGSSDQ